MVRSWRAAVVVGSAAVLAGACSSSNKCQFVDCVPPGTCDPKDGLCKGGTDGGTTDAGSACGVCPATAPVCDGANNTCVTCTASAGCNAITPICSTAVAGGQCVQCLMSSDCPQLQPVCTANNTCAAADAGAPTNLSCATAAAIDVSTGSATIQGTTTGATILYMPGDVSPTCSTSALDFGQTVVYSMTVSGEHDVLASVTPSGDSALQPVLYLRDANCTSAQAADEIACASTFSLPPSIGVGDLDAGTSSTYYLFVSGSAGTSGDFTLQVNLDLPTRPATNISCATAAALTFNGSGQATTSGSTFGSPDTTPALNCDDTEEPSGHGVFYTYTLAATGRVDVTVTPQDGGYGYIPVVWVTDSTDCGSGSTFPLACGTAAQAGGGPATFSFPGQPAGTYSLVVDGFDGTAGPFTLEAQYTAPPSNDNCPGQVLTFDAGTATVAGDTSIAASARGTVSCNGGNSLSGFDLVYQFTLASTQDVQVDVAGDPATNLFPMIFVAPAALCTTDGSGLCGYTQTRSASLFLPSLPAGLYNLWVDTGQDSRGSVGVPGTFTGTVQLTSSSAATSDACPGIALTLDAGAVDGTTNNSASSLTEGCLNPNTFFSSSGPSVVYKVAMPAPGTLSATVTPTASGEEPLLIPGLFLADDVSCTALGDGGCALAAGPGYPAQLVVPHLAAGTYALVVAGANATLGAFTINANWAPDDPLPTNVGCASAANISLDPTPLGFVGTVSGSTADAGAGTQFSCASSADTNSSVVYAFTTPSGVDAGFNALLKMQSTNEDTFTPVFTLRSQCSNPVQGAQLTCATNAPLAWGMALNLKPNQPYSVWVGSNAGGSSAAGPFSLEVDLAPIGPADSDCSGAPALTANTNVAGSTLGALNNFDTASRWYDQADGGTACNALAGNAESGADVVYTYVATASNDATVIMQPEISYQADIAVLDACQPSVCLTAAASTAPGAPVVLTFPANNGHTYFIVVDSSVPAASNQSSGRGGFSIAASQ